jgi:hypothetical protein
MAETEDLPTIRRFGASERVHVRAQQIWLILVAWVMEHRTQRDQAEPITYGELAEKMGLDRRAGRTLARPLGLIGELCVANGLAALNAIVVNDQTGQPGHGVVVTADRTARQEQMEVFRFNWYSARVPTSNMFRAVWEADQ